MCSKTTQVFRRNLHSSSVCTITFDASLVPVFVGRAAIRISYHHHHHHQAEEISSHSKIPGSVFLPLTLFSRCLKDDRKYDNPVKHQDDCRHRSHSIFNRTSLNFCRELPQLQDLRREQQKRTLFCGK